MLMRTERVRARVVLVIVHAFPPFMIRIAGMLLLLLLLLLLADEATEKRLIGTLTSMGTGITTSGVAIQSTRSSR